MKKIFNSLKFFKKIPQIFEKIDDFLEFFWGKKISYNIIWYSPKFVTKIKIQKNRQKSRNFGVFFEKFQVF